MTNFIIIECNFFPQIKQNQEMPTAYVKWALRLYI